MPAMPGQVPSPPSSSRKTTARTVATAAVIGPLGERLTLESLPPPSTTRWVIRRKAEVVAAVAGGLLTVDEACKIYSLSLEEFTGWQRAVDRSGMPGLRVTRIKLYRELYERQDSSYDNRFGPAGP